MSTRREEQAFNDGRNHYRAGQDIGTNPRRSPEQRSLAQTQRLGCIAMTIITRGRPANPRGFEDGEQIIRWKNCPDCDSRGWYLINPFATMPPPAGGMANMCQCETCKNAHAYFQEHGVEPVLPPREPPPAPLAREKKKRIKRPAPVNRIIDLRPEEVVVGDYVRAWSLRSRGGQVKEICGPVLRVASRHGRLEPITRSQIIKAWRFPK